MTHRDESASSNYEALQAAITRNIEARHAAEEANIRAVLTEYIKRSIKDRGPMLDLPDRTLTEIASIAVEALAEFYRNPEGWPEAQYANAPHVTLTAAAANDDDRR